MKCSNCGFENPPTAKFCQNCGHALQLVCPNCAQLYPPDAKFCWNCGFQLTRAPLPQAAAPGAGPANVLQKYMPRELAAKLQAARASRSIEGERRIVTVLFCDVKGSTSIAEKLDPEEWAKIMNDGYSFLIEPVYRYEGTVAQLMGDAILAFFGAPIAHEDDAQRAILAARDIVSGVSEYCARVRRAYGVDFEVRVGVNTGLVVVGNIGTDLKYEYLAMGDAINLAARLQTAAQPNSILISENTQRLAAPYFDFEDKGKLEVKGKAEPIHVYQVLEQRRGPVSARGITGLSSPMVGRRRELATLMQILADLRQGRGSIVSILGDAGLGKSRLAAEWRKPVLTDDSAARVRWFEARCLSYSTSVAHHLNIALLRELIGAPAGSSEEETRRALRELTQDLFGDQGLEVYPYLGHLLGLQMEEEAASRVRFMSGPALLANYVAAFKRLLQTLARSNPLVIVSEDAHWADPSSVEICLQLLPLAAEAPIVFVFILRPEKDAPAWKLVTEAHEIPGAGAIDLYLAPLSENDSQQLVSNLLNLETLPENLRQLIRSKAEGNPFFTEEVIRMLIDRGILARENSHWVTTDPLQRIEIPDTLQGVLLARIDRLPEGAKRTLQIASVIGRRFQARVLAQILGREHGPVLQSELSALEASGLIRLAQDRPEAEYMARHVLIQEAAYSSLLKQDRKQLHEAVGQALEQLYPDRLDEYAPILEQHYVEADDAEKTFDYAARAGDAAGRVYAHTEARFHYARALDALAHLPETDENLRRRVDTLTKLVSVSFGADSPEQNLARLAQAETIVRAFPDAAATRDADRGRLARVHYWMGRSHYYRQEPREAIGYFRQVLAWAQEAHDEELLALPSSLIGQALLSQGQFAKGAPLLEQAIAPLERAANWPEWIRAVTFHAFAEAARGKYAEGLEEGKLGLAKAVETKFLTGIGTSHLMLWLINFMGGNTAAMLEESRATLEVSEQSGDRLYIYFSLGFRAWAESRLGNPEQALKTVAESKAIGQSIGGRLILSDWFAAAEAEFALTAGRADEAQQLAEAAVTIGEAGSSLVPQGLAHRTWAQALASSNPNAGEPVETHLAASLKAFETGEAVIEAARTHAVWGDLARARGDHATAREHLQKAAAQFEASRLQSELERVRELINGLA